MTDSNINAGAANLSEAPSRNMSFGQVISAMGAGHRCARVGWNGIFIYKTVGNTVSKDFIPKFTSLPDSVKKFLEARGEDVVFHPSFTMYTAASDMQPGWLPSQSDILANDWMVLLD